MLDDFTNTTSKSEQRGAPEKGAGREVDLAKFVAYWQRQRRNWDVPMRTDIDPRGIESLLPNAFIAEKVAPGLARLRIAGTHLSDIMGMEVRGMPLSTLIEPADRTRLADALVEVFERPAQLRLELESPGGLRRQTVRATMIILPLRSDLGDISRALGCLVTSGQLGPAPRRFRVVECQVTPVALRESNSDGFAPLTAAPSAAPAGPSARPTRPQPPVSASLSATLSRPQKKDVARHPRERPYLKLVPSS